MPRRRHAENLAEKPASAPVIAVKPKRKRAVRRKPSAAAGKNRSARDLSPRDPARDSVRVQVLAAHVLFLPTRPRCLCLTYAGPAQPTRAETPLKPTIKRTIELPSIINLPYWPLDSTYDRAAEDERLSAVTDRPRPSLDSRGAAVAMCARSAELAAAARPAAQSLQRRFFVMGDWVNRVDPSAAMTMAVVGVAAAASSAFAQARSLHNRLSPFGGAWRWAKARATAAPRFAMRSLRNRILLYVPHLFAIDPRTVAVVAVWSGLISGALVTGVLMRARVQLLKTEALIAQQTPQPAPRANGATENKADNKKTDSRAAQNNGLIESWVESGKTIPAERPRRAGADVRMVDAPVRMKRHCYEQTWPYIAAHCLTVAEEHAPEAAAVPVAANVPPTQSPGDAYAAAPAPPSPSVQAAAHVTESDVKENEVTEHDVTEHEMTKSADRHARSARRVRTSGHRMVASASEDDSSPLPETHRAARIHHAYDVSERHHGRPVSVARSLPVRRETVARSLPVRQNTFFGFFGGPPPFLSFNAY